MARFLCFPQTVSRAWFFAVAVTMLVSALLPMPASAKKTSGLVVNVTGLRVRFTGLQLSVTCVAQPTSGGASIVQTSPVGGPNALSPGPDSADKQSTLLVYPFDDSKSSWTYSCTPNLGGPDAAAAAPLLAASAKAAAVGNCCYASPTIALQWSPTAFRTAPPFVMPTMTEDAFIVPGIKSTDTVSEHHGCTPFGATLVAWFTFPAGAGSVPVVFTPAFDPATVNSSMSLKLTPQTFMVGPTSTTSTAPVRAEFGMTIWPKQTGSMTFPFTVNGKPSGLASPKISWTCP